MCVNTGFKAKKIYLKENKEFEAKAAEEKAA